MLSVCVLVLIFSYSNLGALIVTLIKVGVHDLKLSWNFDGDWATARTTCYCRERLIFIHNCETHLFPSSINFHVYNLVPTYGYTFEVELLKQNADKPFISNTTDLVYMDMNPIIVYDLQMSEKIKGVAVDYGFNISGIWYTDIEIEFSRIPAMPYSLTEQKQVRELCTVTECNRKANLTFFTSFSSGYKYVITFYATRRIFGTVRRSSPLSKHGIIPPRNIRDLAARTTRTPRQVELSWVWPDSGYWTNFSVDCESNGTQDKTCSHSLMPYDPQMMVPAEPFRRLVSDLRGGAHYRFIVELESFGVRSSSSDVTIIVAPGSITDLVVDKSGDNSAELKWLWPVNSFWTHYSVRCLAKPNQDKKCQPALYPFASSEIHQAAAHKHIVSGLYYGNTYSFEVNVEWKGTPAIHAAMSKEILFADSPISASKVSIILISLFLCLILGMISTAILIYYLKRDKMKPARVSHNSEEHSRRFKMQSSKSDKVSATVSSVQGQKPSFAHANERLLMLEQQPDASTEVRKKDFDSKEGSVMQKKLSFEKDRKADLSSESSKSDSHTALAKYLIKKTPLTSMPHADSSFTSNYPIQRNNPYVNIELPLRETIIGKSGKDIIDIPDKDYAIHSPNQSVAESMKTENSAVVRKKRRKKRIE